MPCFCLPDFTMGQRDNGTRFSYKCQIRLYNTLSILLLTLVLLFPNFFVPLVPYLVPLYIKSLILQGFLMGQGMGQDGTRLPRVQDNGPRPDPGQVAPCPIFRHLVPYLVPSERAKKSPGRFSPPGSLVVIHADNYSSICRRRYTQPCAPYLNPF